MSNESMMKKCNEILSLYSKLRIIKYDSDGILFNNGVLLNTKNERDKFIKRIKKQEYYEYFDDLYSVDIDKRLFCMKKIKSNIGKKTGGLSWVKNRKKLYDTVLNNLNKARNSGNCWKKLREKGNWNKGLTKETDNRLMLLSQTRKGNGNPMFGKHLSNEHKRKQSDRMKNKILDGSFTPNIYNRLTHFSCIINGKKYRSSWEGYFALLNPTYEYEKLRIPYQINDKEKVYIVDFISYEDKTVVEIKPERLFNTNKSKIKEQALLSWCKENGFVYKRITEQYIIDNYDENVLQYIDERNRNNIKKVILNENKKY